MAQPVVHYNGNYITCYPGSNQSDDGKLNLEFNMARLVTRVTSKNFCTIKPSFLPRKTLSPEGKPQIELGVGQCSINGMDLIMSSTITIDAPEKAGEYYLIFKLWRDSSNNVLGDEVITTEIKTFKGLYLTYTDTKPAEITDPDVMYLAKISYDGSEITGIEEDEDKYGRISAEDVLCKINDPKHPEVTRLILQDLIYKLPDWYVSKEGDLEYGSIDFMASRLTEGTFGVHIQAVNDDESEFIMKAASVNENDGDKTFGIYTNEQGTKIEIGQTKITQYGANTFTTTSNNNITTKSKLEMLIGGEQKTVIGTGTNLSNLTVTLDNNKVETVSSSNSSMKDSITIDSTSVTHRIGKTDLQYKNNKLSILSTDTTLFEINPNVDIKNNARVNTRLYLGNESTYGNEQTYLDKSEWKISNSTSNTVFAPGTIYAKNDTDKGAYIKLSNNAGNKYSTMYNNGLIDLYNSSANTSINFKDGTGAYDVSISKSVNSKTLNIAATNTIISGNIKASGDITANKVYNAVYNDIAEFMEKADYDEIIEPGDVVYFNENGKVTKWHEGISSTAIAGVVSSEETYGIALGGDGLDDSQKVAIGLKGRVYVKTDNTHIKAGDLICVDSCGCVYKGDHNAFNYIYTLGIATQSEKDGKVYIMLK